MPANIQVADPALERIVDRDASVEKIVSGFEFTEGPVFSRLYYLLFSDIPGERIHKYSLPPGVPGPGGGEVAVFRENSDR
ncbi:MAG: hypothetical protein GY953_30180, partial [bacterium]|nr:hypothetical protein [bacterium]